MKKAEDRKGKKTGGGLSRASVTLAALLFAGFMAVPQKAQAQLCEVPTVAQETLNSFAQEMHDELDNFVTQEQNFLDDKLQSSFDEINARMQEFNSNLNAGLSSWWNDYFYPDLPKLTNQLYIARIDQTRELGEIYDAQNINEHLLEKDKNAVEAQRRLAPNDMSCQMDTAGRGTAKVERMAQALTRTLTADSEAKRSNGAGSTSMSGPAAAQFADWKEYTKYFCDVAHGDQGCAISGTLPAKNTDLPGLLWGQKLSIDMSNADNRETVDAVMRTLIAPTVLDPIPAGTLTAKTPTPQAEAAMLRRRTDAARKNAVYNVIGHMIADRVGGSGVDTSPIRALVGIATGDASTSASYREIQTAMLRDRVLNPSYIAMLVESPAQLVREQTTLNGFRMEAMNDMYKRLEEMVFMEASSYAARLDNNTSQTSKTGSTVK